MWVGLQNRIQLVNKKVPQLPTFALMPFCQAPDDVHKIMHFAGTCTIHQAWQFFIPSSGVDINTPH